ncbi:MAG: response regulator transcription factor [Steroidobacteraceae bacterium]
MNTSDASPQHRPRLLLVDDDRHLAALLEEFLSLQGFQVRMVHDGEAALEAIAADPPDLVVLDVMLPGISGFDVLATLRREHDLPVMMLTARGDESDRIAGLTRGADDYLPKPFNPLELAARIRAVLKRTRVSARAVDPQANLSVGAIALDRKRRDVVVDGTPVALTASELRVLEQLMLRPGEVLSRARLTELALNRPLGAYDRSIDTLISNLRRKLTISGKATPTIRSLRGHGYVLDDGVRG